MVLAITLCSWHQCAVDALGHALMINFAEEQGRLMPWMLRPLFTGGEVELQPLYMRLIRLSSEGWSLSLMNYS